MTQKTGGNDHRSGLPEPVSTACQAASGSQHIVKDDHRPATELSFVQPVVDPLVTTQMGGHLVCTDMDMAERIRHTRQAA